MIRVTDLVGDATARGRLHGERHTPGIRAYTDERVAIVASGVWSGGPFGADEALSLAEAMLPAHREYDEALYEEMTAMAAAAGITPAEAVVVGGFTDFVDVVRARIGAAPEEDTCTAFIVPDHKAGGAGFFGQTWDMHDSATPHVILLDVAEPVRALVFTTEGCVGQLGMNEAGICVGINNLTALDGRIGVTWPFVVRKALAQTTIENALAAVTDAPLAGAHSYLLFDGSGVGYMVEATPTTTDVTKLEDVPLVHTNHFLGPAAAEIEAPRPPELRANSHRRLERGRELLARNRVGVEDLMALTRDDEAICQRATEPFHVESSGAAIMRPATGDFWAVWGRPADNDYEHFELR